jgi:hypothetical protein
MELTVSGPFHDNARDVARLYEDPARTALLLVSLPEDLPLKETEELHARLGPLQGLVRGLVLNELHPGPVPDPALYRGLAASLAARANPAGLEALAMTDSALLRASRQEAARRRLGALGPPVVGLPFLYRRDLGPADLAALLPALERL